jgi:hypothetical protein
VEHAALRRARFQPDCAAVGAVDAPHGPPRSSRGPRSP